LRDYLAEHPRLNYPNAPLFCAVTLKPSKPTGKPVTDSDGNPVAEKAAERKTRQATALAALSVDEAASRLELDWTKPLAHQTFYQAVFRPAVLRANRLAQTEILPPGLTFHALRHTYASLCVAAGIPPLQLSRFMGHAKVTTTLAIYTHLFADDHTETMAALEAMSRPVTPNVVPIRRRG
jgi:integrase